MKTLNITLNKKWFDMIASGEKKEEYREIKPYWISRLTNIANYTIREHLVDGLNHHLNTYLLKEEVFKELYIVSANNGYSKNCPNIKWKHEGITIGEVKPEWGAIPGKIYFILKIGELI